MIGKGSFGGTRLGLVACNEGSLFGRDSTSGDCLGWLNDDFEVGGSLVARGRAWTVGTSFWDALWEIIMDPKKNLQPNILIS